MRKSWTWIACGVAFVGAAMVSSPESAQARPGYLKAFNAAYPKLKEASDTAKCGVCHFGEKKSNRNDYGKATGEALGAKDVKDEKAVEAALKKAEAGKSSTEGKTFGDLINDGKLPGKNP
jgi:cytochrome c553